MDKSFSTKFIYLFSVLLLIGGGHCFALFVKRDHQTAWIWVALFYGIWMILSIAVFLKKEDLSSMFRKASFHWWLIIPVIFAAIAFFGIFIPNIQVYKWDLLLFMNVLICICNPFLEEIYWRGLPSTLFNNKGIQYILASVVFAAGHPLVLGVNSRGAAGWQTFVGAFILGSCWWFYYNKKRSLRWAVFTHFLIDVFGMAAYLLADRLELLM